MMHSLVQQQHDYDNRHSSVMNDEYMMKQHPTYFPSQQRQPHNSHYNDQDQYPSYEKFDAIVQDYLQNLSSKKRDKALIDQARYGMILQVLKDPRNTAVSTAQFRFWVKKMFQLTSRQIVCHDGKPVAMREQIYGILVRAHREAHHGGRDKTSALVRRRYSWIPKELIARFVRHCPFCISRRNGSQHSPLSLGIFLPATPPTYNTMTEESRQRAPSMIASSSIASSSNASYPEEMMMMAAAAAAHHGNSESYHMDLSSWQSPQATNYCYNGTQQQGSLSNTPSIFEQTEEEQNTTNTTKSSYFYNPSSSSEEPMNLSVYYPHDFGMKQNDAYSTLMENNMTFVTPPRHHPLQHMYSPSLSPSSSSTSTTSSPVHPAYHENTTQNESNMGLLSHHQSLF